MATVKENRVSPTYTIELSEQEAKGLATLLYKGVSDQDLDSLTLRSLMSELVASYTPATTLAPAAVFSTLAAIKK